MTRQPICCEPGDTATKPADLWRHHGEGWLLPPDSGELVTISCKLVTNVVASSWRAECATSSVQKYCVGSA